jgi:hypothetical protein
VDFRRFHLRLCAVRFSRERVAAVQRTLTDAILPALGLRARDRSIYARYRRVSVDQHAELSDLRRRVRVVKALVAVRRQGMKRERGAACFFGRLVILGIEGVDRLATALLTARAARIRLARPSRRRSRQAA